MQSCSPLGPGTDSGEGSGQGIGVCGPWFISKVEEGGNHRIEDLERKIQNGILGKRHRVTAPR
jgi:hypothetical protein